MKLRASEGYLGFVVDLDEGRLVPRVIWVDEEEGLLEAFETDTVGRIRQDREGNRLFYRARGRFKFLPLGDPRIQQYLKPAPRVVLGAPACACCRSPLTLPGDDLCPACRAAQRGQRHPMKVEKMPTPLFNRPCDQPGCDRLASWSVADEVAVTPQQQGRTYYERGATVARRFYCSFHYQPPRILDAKGEVMEVLHEAGGVRPQ